MTSNGLLQIAIYFVVILALTKPMGIFMARVFEGKRTFLHPVLRPLEVLIYKLAGVNEDVEQRWTQYAASLLAFSMFSVSVRLRAAARCRVCCRSIRRASMPRNVTPGPGIQHRGQLHDQHQLAELTAANPR